MLEAAAEELQVVLSPTLSSCLSSRFTLHSARGLEDFLEDGWRALGLGEEAGMLEPPTGELHLVLAPAPSSLWS